MERPIRSQGQREPERADPTLRSARPNQASAEQVFRVLRIMALEGDGILLENRQNCVLSRQAVFWSYAGLALRAVELFP
jgi:hypothetical protein